MEKAIMAKIAALAPHLLHTKMYQTGFKEGTSTAAHVTKLLTQIHPGQGRKKRNYAALIDLQKAYDTVNREKLWRILGSRCRNETDHALALLIIKMYQKSQVVIGKHTFTVDLGVVQGGVLSPMLFNVYLEEALSTNAKLQEMVRRGDLLAFADDMLVLTDSKAEMTQAIKELDHLSGAWNLKLNKAKSQVLTEDASADIAGIPCVTQVKYLGVPVHLDSKT